MLQRHVCDLRIIGVHSGFATTSPKRAAGRLCGRDAREGKVMPTVSIEG